MLRSSRPARPPTQHGSPAVKKTDMKPGVVYTPPSDTEDDGWTYIKPEGAR